MFWIKKRVIKVVLRCTTCFPDYYNKNMKDEFLVDFLSFIDKLSTRFSISGNVYVSQDLDNIKFVIYGIPNKIYKFHKNIENHILQISVEDIEDDFYNEKHMYKNLGVKMRYRI